MSSPLKSSWILLADACRPQRLRVALLATLLLAATGLTLLSPLALRRFVDAAAGGADHVALTGSATLFLALAVAGQMLGLLETYLAEDVGWAATNRLRGRLARHCLALDLAFHHTRTPGELLERIDGDVGQLNYLFSRLGLRVVASLLLLAGALAVLAWAAPALALAFALAVGAAFLALHQLRHLAMPALLADRETSAALFGFLEERLAGAEDLRARGAAAYAMRGLAERMRARLAARRRAAALAVAVWGVMIGAVALATAATVLVGGALFQAGALSLGTLVLALAYATLIARPLAQLADHVRELQGAAASAGRIQELLALPVARTEAAGRGGVRLPAGPLGVEVSAVSFAYPGAGAPALCDLSFGLAPGQVLGVLGRTGGGKTTLARLLLRLYDPTAGVVRLGGVDLATADPRSVRDRVALVPQAVHLFHASLRDNLTLFDPRVPDARLLDALRQLGLADWCAALPAGLDTELFGTGGLSAGEAQLLAFVRAFVRDPGLVVLDEASSRLDPATERRLDGAIERLLTGRTGVIIAHRLATVERADALLVLDGSRAVEWGEPAALAADPASRYAALVRAAGAGVVAT